MRSRLRKSQITVLMAAAAGGRNCWIAGRTEAKPQHRRAGVAARSPPPPLRLLTAKLPRVETSRLAKITGCFSFRGDL